MSTLSLARPSRPLVAMITVAAGSTIAALKSKNLTVFDPYRIVGELAHRTIEAGMEDRYQ